MEESVNSDAVEVIRDGLRQLVHTERKENRTRILNKNRVDLGNIVTNSSFTTEFVVEKARALKKKALSIEEYKQLQNALIQSEQHVNSFLKVDNILFALVRDFSGNDEALQLCAISCACNIALGNTKACTSLTKSIGPYLITRLSTLNYPLLDVCVWTIGNLIAGSSKAFEILHAQGCLTYITLLMCNCDNSHVLSSIAYTAMHYVHIGFRHISDNEIIQLTKATMKSNLSLGSPYFIWLIALLSSQIACNAYLYSIVPLIVDYLYGNITNNFRNISEITACIRVLANTMQETSGQLAMFLIENPKYTRSDLETLLNELLSCQYIHIRKETLWLIGNLYNHNRANVKKIMRNIIQQLPFLNQAITSTIQPVLSLNTNLE
ncbi:uncharacterized protein LOC143426654 isoform X2 [Xylocopa sonorina]|uniref:uncharacterized protein LOC143426654 isoform X2 n=1 Tax=Xylocopa sonorina TaxID=1818115 RepID=UPI00403B072F